MSLHFIPEIAGEVLLSRFGNVHQRNGKHVARCGQSIPDRHHTTVSHVQAVVHKLPLCQLCYPAHHRDGGRRG